MIVKAAQVHEKLAIEVGPDVVIATERKDRRHCVRIIRESVMQLAREREVVRTGCNRIPIGIDAAVRCCLRVIVPARVCHHARVVPAQAVEGEERVVGILIDGPLLGKHDGRGVARGIEPDVVCKRIGICRPSCDRAIAAGVVVPPAKVRRVGQRRTRRQRASRIRPNRRGEYWLVVGPECGADEPFLRRVGKKPRLVVEVGVPIRRRVKRRGRRSDGIVRRNLIGRLSSVGAAVRLIAKVHIPEENWDRK